MLSSFVPTFKYTFENSIYLKISFLFIKILWINIVEYSWGTLTFEKKNVYVYLFYKRCKGSKTRNHIKITIFDMNKLYI